MAPGERERKREEEEEKTLGHRVYEQRITSEWKRHPATRIL